MASNLKQMTIACWRQSVFTVGAMATLALVANSAPANAQLTPWGSGNSVLVDQSVLGGQNGQRPVGSLPGISGFGDGTVLAPPVRMPRSQLLVKSAPGGSGAGASTAPTDAPRIKLRRPGTAKTTAPRKPKRRAATPARQASKTAAIAKPAKPLAPPAPKLAAKPPRAPKLAVAAPPIARVKAPTIAKPTVKKAATRAKQKTASVAPAPPAIAKPKPVAPPASAKPAPPAPQQTASRTGAATPTAAGAISFTSGGATLAAPGRSALDKMAARLKQEGGVRLQLLAYAGEPNLSASKARRLSLSRALAVRSYLISKGVRSTRIDVRALGNRLPSGAPSRVDLVVK